MEKKRDYYEVLGVNKDADSSAIKKAYRKLAKNTTRTPMPVMQRQKNDSKKSQKLMQY